MVRNFLVCEADFPNERNENIVDGGEPIPPGRELAEFLQTVLRDHTDKMSEVWNEEDYAWGFNCDWDRVAINVQAGRVDDRWLLIFSIVSIVPRFLRSRKYEVALRNLCERVDLAVRTDSRFRDVRWCTRTEFEASNVEG